MSLQKDVHFKPSFFFLSFLPFQVGSHSKGRPTRSNAGMNQEVLDEWGVEEDCPRNGTTNGWFNIVAWIHGFVLCAAVSIQR
ncbi:hypothetical protein CEXT_355311 [Caerostris extrusa]|uniref:Uncharacterized protein n=1 Tax=Caerostris extrusa TaxID=172846 RepID=A0AAV4NVM8_CAEEX|nr:hypothetical protein CEXT_355311 [Caerostris extrusa]